VELCKTETFDLILMDVQMPEMDGYTAARQIRGSDGGNRNVPILALTANAENDTRAHCLHAGMNDVLTKPVRRGPMLSVVNQWLARGSVRPPESTREVEPEQAADHAPADGDPIDMTEAVREFGGNAELLMTVVNQFLAQVQQQVPMMREALTRSDADTIRQEAHKIKGGAANLTAGRVSDWARRIESLAGNNQLDEIAEMLDTLDTEMDNLRRFLAAQECES
jgi:DNA-binding response OmpR family regulator